MAELVQSGRGVELILWLMIAEGIVLVVYHVRTGRGITPANLLPNLAAGMLLLLAMRFAQGGAWWGWVCLCLLSALAAHLADLSRRWRR